MNSITFHPPCQLMSFVVLGEPMSKARARVVNGHAFTPERTRVAEAQVQAAFLASPQRYVPSAEAGYRVDAKFHAATRQRRDVDNMLKLILDALNKYAWADDTQVLEIHARKDLVALGDERTEVTIYSLPPLLGLQATCRTCGQSFRTYPSQAQQWCSIPCRTKSRLDARRRTCKGCSEIFDPGPRYKGRAYCTLECKKAHLTVDMVCIQCSTTYNRPQSWASNGHALCSVACREAYWREHAASSARGICADCGGATSKRCYARCRPCGVLSRAPS